MRFIVQINGQVTEEEIIEALIYWGFKGFSVTEINSEGLEQKL